MYKFIPMQTAQRLYVFIHAIRSLKTAHRLFVFINPIQSLKTSRSARQLKYLRLGTLYYIHTQIFCLN